MVVNDSAEKGIKLIEDFNGNITRSEYQIQFLIQMTFFNLSLIKKP